MDEYINKTKFEELMRKKARNNFDLYYADKSKRYHANAIGYTIAADEAHVFPASDVQTVNQWISCQDKMPEEYKTVLVYEKDYGVMIGELEKKFFDTQYFIARKSGLILRTTEVTHWQPLPAPPKEA